ncbi:MAG: DUF3408 domain-containing protein [Alistipes indistinctus]
MPANCAVPEYRNWPERFVPSSTSHHGWPPSESTRNPSDEQAILEIVAGKNERVRPPHARNGIPPSCYGCRVATPAVQPVPQPAVSAERMAAYEQEFLRGMTLSEPRSLHIDGELHRRVAALTGISGTQVTVSGFARHVLEHHFREHGAEITGSARPLLSILKTTINYEYRIDYYPFVSILLISDHGEIHCHGLHLPPAYLRKK